MTSLAKTKALVTVSLVALLALGTSGCSNEKRNRRFSGGMNPYYQQQKAINNQGVTGANWENVNQDGTQNLGDGTSGGNRGTRSDGRGRGSDGGASGCKDGSCNNGQQATEKSADYLAGNSDALAGKPQAKNTVDYLTGYRDGKLQMVQIKTDPATQQLNEEIQEAEKALALTILESKKVPDWKKKECKGDSASGDMIPDDCKALSNLDEELFYGYRVAGVQISKEKMKELVKSASPKKDNWFSSASKKVSDFFGGLAGFNKTLAKLIAESDGNSVTDSSLKILSDLVDVGEPFRALDAYCETMRSNPDVPTKCKDGEKVAWIRGGYEEPVLFNPADGWSGTFNSAKLTGLGRSTGSFGVGDKFLYVAEGFVKVEEARKIALAVLNGRGGEITRKAGAFFVFYGQDLLITNIGLGMDLSEPIYTLTPPGGYGCPQRLVLAAVFEQSKESESLFKENLVIQALFKGDGTAAGENTWELLPQQISTTKVPEECEDAINGFSIIDKISPP